MYKMFYLGHWVEILCPVFFMCTLKSKKPKKTYKKTFKNL